MQPSGQGAVKREVPFPEGCNLKIGEEKTVLIAGAEIFNTYREKNQIISQLRDEYKKGLKIKVQGNMITYRLYQK